MIDNKTLDHKWEPEIILLHSNDLHSRLEAAAKMATYMDEQRQLLGSERVLAVDCGDHMDRMRVETEGSSGRVNVELLNAAGYEAVALGNNEGLTFTRDALVEAYGYAHFAVLAANMNETETSRQPDWVLPHTIIRKGPFRIGLIGVTASYQDFYTLLGWDVPDPLPVVQREVEKIRTEVDVVVILSHLGLPYDRQMAEAIPGIDLILGGHTHHLLEEPLLIGETLICAAGKHGERIGRVEIGIDPQSKLPVFRASVVEIDHFAEHPVSAAIISRFLSESRQLLSRTVASLEVPLQAGTDHESPLANLLAAGIRRWTGAQIGIVNAGQLLGNLGSGPVSAGELHALCPSPINPCLMTLSGRDIRLALEESMLDEFKSKAIRGFGFRGLVLGTLAVDGLEIEYAQDGDDEARIVSIKAGGELVQDDRDYEVGTIDMFTFGAGYLSLQQGSNVRYFLPEFLRDVLALELQNSEAVHDSKRLRFIRLISK